MPDIEESIEFPADDPVSAIYTISADQADVDAINAIILASVQLYRDTKSANPPQMPFFPAAYTPQTA